MASKQRLATADAPPPLPVFSQGVRRGPVLQVSGQSGIDRVTETFDDRVDTQTRHALDHVRAILEAGGATLEDVVMMRMYLTTRDDFAAMNEVYAEYMTEHVPSGVLPARTTVFVELPHPQMLVEIDALAVVGA